MEVVVFGVRYHSLIEHILVVLLASISSIGDDLPTLLGVFLQKSFQIFNQGFRIVRTLKNSIVDDSFSVDICTLYLGLSCPLNMASSFIRINVASGSHFE